MDKIGLVPVGVVRDLLTELVRCPSVNPGRKQEVDAPYGEGRLAALLAERLKAMGGDVHCEDVHPGRPNVWAFFEGRDTSRTVLLDAHSDTVSHLNMDVDPFGAEVRDGRLYGRGACDTKGPMTAFLAGLERVIQAGRLACNTVFAATCDEEDGGVGAEHLLATGIRADFAIAAEPTELRIVSRHKGVLRGRIATSGTAAHTSAPHRGANAIYPMVRILSRLEDHADELEGHPADPELGRPTLAVTTLHGGTACNVVPCECVADIDRRTLPSEDTEKVCAALEALVHAAAADAKWCDPRVEWTQHYPPLETPRSDPGVRALEAALQAVRGAALYEAAPYGTNGGFYARAGIPSVVFGPGSISDAHTRNESIALDQVAAAADVIVRLLLA